MKYNLCFHCSENTAFYIFTAVKYSFMKICNIFKQYFPVFHYFVYNKLRCGGGKCNLHGRAIIMFRCFINLKKFNFQLTKDLGQPNEGLPIKMARKKFQRKR